MPLTKISTHGINDGTIVNADINASAAIVSTKLSGVNDAKAWVNFDGTGTPAIGASFNVTSITDNGTGDYTVNFTNAMTDVNYAFFGGGSYLSTRTGVLSINPDAKLVGSVRMIHLAMNLSSSAIADAAQCSVSIFR